MTRFDLPGPGLRASGLTRRMVLIGGGVVVLGGCRGRSVVGQDASASASASADFLAISRALTGYADLDGALGGRIEAVLRQGTPAFAPTLAQLALALRATAPAVSLADLPEAPRKLASLILAAWQTGVAGEGARAVVVAYEDTLMYRPIADVCVLPTYARGAPHYWARPPVTGVRLPSG